jgi:Leucine-rich repeat (LRR) protein
LQTGTFNYVGQETKEIPPELFKLEELPLDGQNWWDCNPITKMDFSNNEITVVSEKISIFADLQLLRMKNNQLLSLPLCLPSLQTFKLLDVSRNKISSLPK